MGFMQIYLLVTCLSYVYVVRCVEVDDIIADAIQDTYLEPQRDFGAGNDTIPETGNSFAFLQKQKDDEDQIARAGFKYLSFIENLIQRSGKSFGDLESSDEYQRSLRTQLCDSITTSCKKYKYSRYRSADGLCNNLRNPTWGVALQAHARYLHPVYDDGYNSPRQRGRNEGELPSPGQISNTVLGGDMTTPADDKRNLMLFTFGQFIDHGLTFTPIVVGRNGDILDCCGLDASDPECFTIEIPTNDPRFPGRTCMDFSRSIPTPPEEGCSIGPRQQVNRLSSFIDAGMLYGDSKRFNENLNGRVGTLRTSSGDMLPPGGVCQTSEPEDFCQLAGDERSNEFPSLGGLHVVFLRLHNIIAKEIRQITGLSSQDVFLETKKIMGAIMQQVTYGEFLPAILGKDTRKKFCLNLRRKGYWNKYNPKVNPTVKNVIATAALRYGHSQIPPELGYMTRMFATSRVFKSEDVFMDPHIVVTQQGQNIPDLARFLLGTPARKVDRQIENAARNELFPDVNGVTFDLMSFNIQRGRDHGLPTYNEWRKLCKLPVATTFSELQDHNSDAIARLQDVYDHVDDIDVFVGGISETPRADAVVGPLFECLLGWQFKELRFGDRYWYETKGIEGFSRGQLREIRKMTFSKILCEALNLDEIQKEVFNLVGPKNPRVKCSSLPFMDLSEWKKSFFPFIKWSPFFTSG
ncbi:peroxidasin homolog pxn-2-like [Saccostrea cucullata]|uniref:peroxidasin homolog pxn-2-like n=1 Tax=Saccostrea cuccullata TaxID=36930 RepID=UPI002ED58554